MASSSSTVGGGVDRVTLMPVNSGGVRNPPLVEIEIVRGRSIYRQEMSMAEGMPLYTHTLELVTPLDVDIFRDVAVDQLVGVRVKLTCGESITLGWSEMDQPLRLVAQSVSSAMVAMSKSEQISGSPSPVKHWTLRAYSTSAVV